MNPYRPMTDEELDRALDALPLAMPPPGLRTSLLALTVYAQRPFLRPLEIVGLGGALAFAVWLAIYVVLTGAPVVSVSVSLLNNLLLAFSDLHTTVWLALGAAAALCATLIDGGPRLIGSAASMLRRRP